jgi:RNA polymerase sigma-70 factor, ECF subfamily
MRDDRFELLYEEHAQRLYGFLVYRCGSRVLAEDLLADTFERALRGRRGFDRRRASEKTWLYAIALNTLRDHARRAAAESRALERSQAAEPAGDGVSPLDGVGRHDDLYQALDTLSGEEREALALRFGADLTVPEIARLTKEPLTTVEGRVYRALRKLRDELRFEPEPEHAEARSGMDRLVRISG